MDQRFWFLTSSDLEQLAATLFKQPLDSQIARMFEGADALGENDFPFGNRACLEGYREMASSSSDLRGISDDFHRLFVGPYKLVAPPWESAYRNDRKLYGPAEIEVCDDYKRMGFTPPAEEREPFDHFAYELLFISALKRRFAEECEGGSTDNAGQALEAARSFSESHIEQWSEDFLNDVKNGARTPFYRGLARFAEGLLQINRELLKEEFAALCMKEGE